MLTSPHNLIPQLSRARQARPGVRIDIDNAAETRDESGGVRPDSDEQEVAESEVECRAGMGGDIPFSGLVEIARVGVESVSEPLDRDPRLRQGVPVGAIGFGDQETDARVGEQAADVERQLADVDEEVRQIGPRRVRR